MTIRPSVGRNLLVAALALAAVRALALCELPSLAFALLALAALALAVRDMRAASGGTTLTLDEEGRWHVERPGGEAFSGRLLERGYRGAAFVALVIEADDGVRRRPRRRHVVVPADSIDAADFSWLHLRLAFAGEGT